MGHDSLADYPTVAFQIASDDPKVTEDRLAVAVEHALRKEFADMMIRRLESFDEGWL